MTKPSRFLENGFAAACGGSFAVDSADKSEKRIRHSALTEPSVPMQSAAPDRFDAELDRARARRTCGRHRNRGALGPEALGEMLRHGREQAAFVNGMEAARRAGAQKIVVSDRIVGAGAGR